VGLRDIFRVGLPGGGPAGGYGTAEVLDSRPVDADETQTGVRTNHEVVSNDLWYLNLGKRPHILRLEVRFPGAEPYETEVRVRVPVKFAPGSSLKLPAGVDLPVRRTGEAPEDIEVDWKAFGDDKTTKRDVKRAAAREHNASVREGLEHANPGQQAMLREANAAQLPSLVQMVKDGKLKRKTFDQNMQTLVTLGQLDEGLFIAAKAELDGS
jgi:hypothetical protein